MVDFCAGWQRVEGSLAWSLTLSEESSEQCTVMSHVPGEMESRDPAAQFGGAGVAAVYAVSRENWGTHIL